MERLAFGSGARFVFAPMPPSPVPIATPLERARWILRRRRRFTVVGPSMEPTLRAGQVVLVNGRGVVAVGDVVVATHPRRSGLKIVKRLAEQSADGGWVLSSDNTAEPHSEDSRTFGPAPADAIVGRVTSVVQ